MPVTSLHRHLAQLIRISLIEEFLVTKLQRPTMFLEKKILIHSLRKIKIVRYEKARCIGSNFFVSQLGNAFRLISVWIQHVDRCTIFRNSLENDFLLKSDLCHFWLISVVRFTPSPRRCFNVSSSISEEHANLKSNKVSVSPVIKDKSFVKQKIKSFYRNICSTSEQRSVIRTVGKTDLHFPFFEGESDRYLECLAHEWSS